MLKIVKRISLTSAIAAAVFMVIQVLADLYLPTLTSNIIDKGVAQGDVDYIWHTGFVMIGFSLISILAAIANTFFATVFIACVPITEVAQIAPTKIQE